MESELTSRRDIWVLNPGLRLKSNYWPFMHRCNQISNKWTSVSCILSQLVCRYHIHALISLYGMGM